MLSILAETNPLEHIVDHTQFHFLGLPITNHMILMVIAALLMLLIFPALTAAYRDGASAPSGTKNFFEAMLVFVRNDVAQPALGDSTLQFLPFLWTLFFFILINNLLGLLPLNDLTGMLHNLGLPHPFGGTATSNIYVTGTLAAIAFVVMQVSGLRANGIKNYLKHFLGGAPIFMAPIMVIVEIIGMFVKPFALAVRLFANMTAGHVLLAVLIGFVSVGFTALGTGGGLVLATVVVIGSVAIMCLELFVAFLQAYIFTFLTALFIGLLVVHENHDSEHESAHGHEGHGGAMAADDQTPEAVRQAAAHLG